MKIGGVVWSLVIVSDIAGNYVFLGSHVNIVVHIVKFFADPRSLAPEIHVTLFEGRGADRGQVSRRRVQVRFFVFDDFVCPDLHRDLVGHVGLTVLEFIAIVVLIHLL